MTRRTRAAARMTLLPCLTAAALLAAFLGVAQETASASLVINEVEINPAGRDHGAEWIEIVNLSDQAVDLAGWPVSYAYRGPGPIALVDGARALGPGERFVFVYPRIALINAMSNVIRLIDPTGWLVDETSPLLDANDSDGTWQRFPDGGDPWFPDLWIFNEATRGRSND